MASNIEYLNGVRNLASEIYQDRIPVATKENLAQVTQAILEFPSREVGEFFTFATRSAFNYTFHKLVIFDNDISKCIYGSR